MTQQDKKYLSERFGIPKKDIVWYNAGICYARIIVNTKESADKVSESVKGQTVNGGMFHGMSLGGQTKVEEGYDVTC